MASAHPGIEQTKRKHDAVDSFEDDAKTRLSKIRRPDLISYPSPRPSNGDLIPEQSLPTWNDLAPIMRPDTVAATVSAEPQLMTPPPPPPLDLEAPCSSARSITVEPAPRSRGASIVKVRRTNSIPSAKRPRLWHIVQRLIWRRRVRMSVLRFVTSLADLFAALPYYHKLVPRRRGYAVRKLREPRTQLRKLHYGQPQASRACASALPMVAGSRTKAIG